MVEGGVEGTCCCGDGGRLRAREASGDRPWGRCCLTVRSIGARGDAGEERRDRPTGPIGEQVIILDRPVGELGGRMEELRRSRGVIGDRIGVLTLGETGGCTVGLVSGDGWRGE